MAKIRVTHVIRLDETPDSPPLSGAENHLLFLLPGLVSLGLDVELIVISRFQGALMKGAFDTLKNSGIRVTLLPLTMKTEWYCLRSLALQRTFDLIDLLRVRKDRVIHLHLDYFGAPVAAWLAGCSKVIMSIHNDEDWLAALPMRVWLRFLNLIVWRYIGITERVKDYFIRVSNVRPARIKRIYYGVKYKSPEFSSGQLRDKYNIPPNQKVVGYVGRLVYQKHVDLLVEAARALPHIHFVIVGEGELRRSLQEQAVGLKNIQFLGYQPDGYKIIPAFDIFCLPSRFEGLGLVLVEAMLLGVPIIASRAGAIPEILRQGKYGVLFNVGDLKGLLEAIKHSFENYDAMCSMAIQSRDFATSFFSIEEMTIETVNLYNETK